MSDAPQRREPAKPAPRRATGTDTVTILCNLPTGLIMQLYDVEEVEAVLPNGRVIKENVATLNLQHGQWALNGVAEFSTLAIAGRDVPDYRVLKGDAPGTGYALTSGIPRDFAERWFKDNERSPIVLGKHVKMMGTESGAVGWAREMRERKSGFQGLDQGGDYRVPNGIRKFRPSDMSTGPVAEAEATEGAE